MVRGGIVLGAGVRNKSLADAVAVIQASPESSIGMSASAIDVGADVRHLKRSFSRYLDTTAKKTSHGFDSNAPDSP